VESRHRVIHTQETGRCCVCVRVSAGQCGMRRLWQHLLPEIRVVCPGAVTTGTGFAVGVLRFVLNVPDKVPGARAVDVN
jgi:hypothetical protein